MTGGGEGGSVGWRGLGEGGLCGFFCQIPLRVERGKVSLPVLKGVQNTIGNLGLFNPSLVSWP